MRNRPRHGLHLVPRNAVLPQVESSDGTARVLAPARRAFVSLSQESVVVAVGGRLNADTAGRLRLFLTMFTLDGGPRELVVDLAGAYTVDDAGMSPIWEADEAMRLRAGALWLAHPSPAVTHYLEDGRHDRALAVGTGTRTDPGHDADADADGTDGGADPDGL
jgi:anti-anti-sigma regulatory factor